MGPGRRTFVTDALVEVGTLVSDSDLVTNVIKALDDSFDSITDIAPLLTRFPTFFNFRNMLLLQEIKVVRRTANTSASTFVAKGPRPLLLSVVRLLLGRAAGNVGALKHVPTCIMAAMARTRGTKRLQACRCSSPAHPLQPVDRCHPDVAYAATCRPWHPRPRPSPRAHAFVASPHVGHASPYGAAPYGAQYGVAPYAAPSHAGHGAPFGATPQGTAAYGAASYTDIHMQRKGPSMVNSFTQWIT
jgi:hypothetical protein